MYGLGPAVSIDDVHLPKSKLPTVRMVLRALKYLTTEKVASGNRTYYESAKVYPQIEYIFGRAGVPLQSTLTGSDPEVKEMTVSKKLVKILEKDKSFRKMPKGDEVHSSWIIIL